jgi:UDP-2,4-diacetamido-2,4,6-trideoxy-beta-L-altropyranose hydrolase
VRVAIRADASLYIGTGHVMRCLTLADALAARGADCLFICRAHNGNMIDLIRNRGFRVHDLPASHESGAALTVPCPKTPGPEINHRRWLGATQEQDALDCTFILAEHHFDWLIVDHYALDARWESALGSHCDRLMVIDDLADRRHDCDLLLDQTHGRDAADYRFLVPADCRLLLGSQYALLRPEFAALRPYSLQRRTQPALRELLITMGGIDKDNVTGQVLQALIADPLPSECRITVVMGAAAPSLEEVRSQAGRMKWPTRVLVGVSNMGQLMAESDLAIGAAGATAWERCCLGLPTIMFILAGNQHKIAESLNSAGAALLRSLSTLRTEPLIEPECLNPLALRAMSAAAASITQGLGADHVIDILLDTAKHANQSAVQR